MYFCTNAEISSVESACDGIDGLGGLCMRVCMLTAVHARSFCAAGRPFWLQCIDDTRVMSWFVVGAGVIFALFSGYVYMAVVRPSWLLSASFVTYNWLALALLTAAGLAYFGVFDGQARGALTAFGGRVGAFLLLATCGLAIFVWARASGASTAFYALVSPTILAYFTNALYVTIVAVGLSVFQTLYADWLRKLPGWTGFVANLVFAIPCYLASLARAVLREYASTPRTVLLLLAVEAALIAMIWLIPMLARAVDRWLQIGKVVVEGPVPLSPPTVVPNRDLVSIDRAPRGLSDEPRGVRFALSAWIYVNPTDTGRREYPLLRFGDPVTGSGFGVFFVGEHTEMGSAARSRGSHWRFDLGGGESVVLPVTSQRWHHVAVYYPDENQADLFLDGVLVHHQAFRAAANRRPAFAPTDMFHVGFDEDKVGPGISGAVRDVRVL